MFAGARARRGERVYLGLSSSFAIRELWLGHFASNLDTPLRIARVLSYFALGCLVSGHLFPFSFRNLTIHASPNILRAVPLLSSSSSDSASSCSSHTYGDGGAKKIESLRKRQRREKRNTISQASGPANHPT